MSNPYFVNSQVISETIKFDCSKNANLMPFNIAYGIDENFLFGCGVSIASVLMHNKNMHFVFHVFIDSISNENMLRFKQLAERYKTCIHIHIVDCKTLYSLPTTKNWSVAMYFRFIIADYFAGQVERVLYLDADIICKGKLEELTTIELGCNVAAVVPERDSQWWAIRAQSLACPALENCYFNSGFLLINISAWLNAQVSQHAMLMLQDSKVAGKLSYMDQDILNLLLFDKVMLVDSKYNTQFSLNYELKSKFVNPINDATILIHYVGPTKPWHAWANYPSSLPFINARKNSPWASVPLMQPINSNYARYCAKHNFKQGNTIMGVKNYIYYFYLKIKK